MYWFMKNILCFSVSMSLLLCLSGCKSSREKIEKTFEDTIGIDLPSNFKIVENGAWGIIDLGIEYDIEYDTETFEKIVSELDMNNWEQNYPGSFDFIGTRERGVTVQIQSNIRQLSYIYTD